MKFRNIDLREISNILSIDYVGNNQTITGLNLSNRSSCFDSILSYTVDSNFTKKALQNSKIKALFISKDCEKYISKNKCSYFIVDCPEESFYQLHKILVEKNYYKDKINNRIGLKCNIHSSVTIEDNVIIGDNVTISPNSVVKKNSVIESNVFIGDNSVIGSEGFEILFIKKKIPYYVPHVGGVFVKKNVFVGSNTTICKSLFEGYTIIGKNTKIDNQVHIAHNCDIGENCVIVPGVVLLGSVTVKDNVWLASNSVVLNKVIVNENSVVGSLSFVTRDVKSNTTVFGNPAKVIKR